MIYFLWHPLAMHLWVVNELSWKQEQRFVAHHPLNAGPPESWEFSAWSVSNGWCRACQPLSSDQRLPVTTQFCSSIPSWTTEADSSLQSAGTVMSPCLSSSQLTGDIQVQTGDMAYDDFTHTEKWAPNPVCFAYWWRKEVQQAKVSWSFLGGTTENCVGPHRTPHDPCWLSSYEIKTW
jgi:hypothetical protein